MASTLTEGHFDDTARLYWPQNLQHDLDVYPILSSQLQQVQSPAPISFHPDVALYEARREKRLREEVITQTLPQGWPKELKGPLVWSRSDFTSDEGFVVELCDAEKDELASALGKVKDEKLSYDEITIETFPLPTLSRKLQLACNTVYSGIGFIILRGFDADSCTAEDCLKVFLGVSSYVAAQRAPQDHLGNILKHLVDYGRVDSDRDLPLHTDMTADVVATMALKCSDVGGDGTVASVWTIYNELAATRADLVHVLADPSWPFDTYGRIPAYYNRALVYYHDNRVIMNFSRRVLTGHPISRRSEGIPGLTEAQAEALDAVHFIARKHSLQMATRKGDMRFINNFAILHGREPYSDANSIGTTNKPEQNLSQRHLLRLWLHNEKMAWKLPPVLRLVWARGFGDVHRRRVWDEVQRLLGDGGIPEDGGSGGQPPPPPAYPCD